MNVSQKSFVPTDDIFVPARQNLAFRPKPAVPTAELSYAQQRLWFLEQMAPGRATYAMPMAVELRGTLDRRMLERALGSLVRRHESLRTVFTVADGQPQQVVLEPGEWTLPVTDLKRESNARARLNELLTKEVGLGFDLTSGPLFRTRLYQLSDDHHVLLLAMHHIISDGWSLGILFRELGEFYGRFCRGENADLPPTRIQYRDFTRWQRSQLQGDAMEKLLEHWRTRLDRAPQVVELPTERPRPAMETNHGAVYQFILPQELADALRRFALREKATLFMPLFAGFAAMLARYSGLEDFLIGTPAANRNRPEFENIVGFFINTVVLRADLSGDPTVGDLLRRTRQICLDAFQHQDLPFERLVEEMQPERDLSRNPLIQVMFSLENMPLPPLQLPGLTQSRLDLDRKVTHVDLTLRALESADGIRARLEYSTDLFDAAAMERMAAHWRTLLEAMVASPQCRLSELPMLTGSERKRILIEWNDTTVEYPESKCVHMLFEEQAARTPDAPAIADEQEQLSYAELNRRADSLATELRQLGSGPGARVGICLERSLTTVAGLLGILKTGAAYVPLDPAFPQDRLRFMATDAQISVMLTRRSLKQQLNFEIPGCKWLCVDEINQKPGDAEHAPNPGPADRGQQSKSAAYVIYTSGSTGRPKGVVIPHQAVVNFLTSMAREPGLAANDSLVAVTTLSFDIAVLELLLPLSVGARVAIATRDQTVDGHALVALLKKHQASVMQAAPVTWRILLETDWKPEQGFKALVGGETLPLDLAEELLARGVELWNMYGPTETTVWSTCARITNPSNGITIGRPIANTTIRILDPQKNPCPIGVAGELFIGGQSVSSGYWNRPELTEERFVPDPFDTSGRARLYRTGDRARWRTDGTIEHLGRLDYQIKLRGFRIEPGEIEAIIAQEPTVNEVSVVMREDSPGDKRLVAYLVAGSQSTGLLDELRGRLRSTLPEYMVPSHFVVLKALPRTPNGKLDRGALPLPTPTSGTSAKIVAPPRTPTEEMVLEVFRAVLDRTDFGVADSFFDLGGHSLMAARLILKLRATSGLDLPMRLLFERPTPTRLAEAIDSLSWLKQAKTPAMATAGREEIEL